MKGFLNTIRIVTVLVIIHITIPSHTNAFDLTILHTNDIHSYLAGSKRISKKPCYTTTETQCIGGIARLAQVILDIRQNTPTTILLDAGDFFLGTAFFADYLSTPEQFPFIPLYNRLGYDAATIGNHEFDFGSAMAISAIKKLQFPIIVANLTFTKPEMQEAIKPWTIIEREGKRIGIIGVVAKATEKTSKAGPEAIFENEEKSIRAAINEIKKHNVYTIILLSHAGLKLDLEFASKIDGISVVVGGHTHNLLSNGNPKTSPYPIDGPYPIVKTSPSGKPVLVITAKSNGEYLGRLDVSFDKHGVPSHWKGGPIYLENDISNDPAVTSVAQLLDSYGEPIQKRLNVKIGEIYLHGTQTPNTPQNHEAPIDGKIPFFYCRKQEGLTANIILDALYATGKQYGAQAAIVPAGLIRAPFPIGPVTMLDVDTILPFSEHLLVGTIRGDQLMKAFENGASDTHLTHIWTGKFLQVSGMQVVYDSKKPEGSRIVSLKIRNQDGQFEPVDSNKTYTIITTKFIAGGGDKFTMLKDVQWKDIHTSMQTPVIEYIKKYSPIEAQFDKRIIRLGPELPLP